MFAPRFLQPLLPSCELTVRILGSAFIGFNLQQIKLLCPVYSRWWRFFGTKILDKFDHGVIDRSEFLEVASPTFFGNGTHLIDLVFSSRSTYKASSGDLFLK